MLNKNVLYIDRKWEFYIGYSPDEECWMLVSIPGMARSVLDPALEGVDEEPITVTEIETMLAKGIVVASSSKIGSGTWSKIFDRVDLEIAKIKEVQYV